MKAVWTIAKRELVAYFTSPVAYIFLVIFLLLTGFFTFTAGSFFEPRRSEPRRLLRLASVAVPGARAGGRHARLGGGAPLGNRSSCC
jgi:ABC-type transport system involved in multi-copper enzyme maturation permease subunit